MDYKRFFSDCAEWVLEVNKQAVKYGMDSDQFWRWIVKSSTDMCESYNNNKLVINQMAMLVDWVQDIYRQSKGAAG
jgi:hypothetical protein